MKSRVWLLTAVLLALSPFAAHAADGRFSQMLTTNESVECGVNRLSSDQAAVLDALVRRDLATQAKPRRDDQPLAPKFSQRLSADERRNAGFALMTEAQIAKLDTYVERFGAGTLARSLLAPPVYFPTGMRQLPTEARTTPEVHGSFTLQYGVGSGGYSEKAGGMNLNYTDPVRNFAVSFSYWESHTKGGGIPYRDGSSSDAPPPFVP